MAKRGVEDGSAFLEKRTDEWQWTLIVMIPPQVNQALLEKAKSPFTEKKNPPLPNEVRLEALHDGPSGQLFHVGRYHDVEHSIQRVMTHIGNQGQPRGKVHERSLSDPRRTAPDRLKTFVRQPFYRPNHPNLPDCST